MHLVTYCPVTAGPPRSAASTCEAGARSGGAFRGLAPASLNSALKCSVSKGRPSGCRGGAGAAVRRRARCSPPPALRKGLRAARASAEQAAWLCSARGMRAGRHSSACTPGHVDGAWPGPGTDQSQDTRRLSHALFRLGSLMSARHADSLQPQSESLAGGRTAAAVRAGARSRGRSRRPRSPCRRCRRSRASARPRPPHRRRRPRTTAGPRTPGRAPRARTRAAAPAACARATRRAAGSPACAHRAGRTRAAACRRGAAPAGSRWPGRGWRWGLRPRRRCRTTRRQGTLHPAQPQDDVSPERARAASLRARASKSGPALPGGCSACPGLSGLRTTHGMEKGRSAPATGDGHGITQLRSTRHRQRGDRACRRPGASALQQDTRARALLGAAVGRDAGPRGRPARGQL